MSSDYDKPIDVGLAINSSDLERDSYYLDFDKGIDSDIELEPGKGPTTPPEVPAAAIVDSSCKDAESSSDNKTDGPLKENPGLDGLPKLKNVAKHGEDLKPAKQNAAERDIEEMPTKPSGGGGASSEDSKQPKPPPSPKAPKLAAGPVSVPTSRKPQRSPETKEGSRAKPIEKPPHKKSDSDISKPQSSKPKPSQSASNLNQEAGTSAQPQRVKKPPTPNHAGTDERTKTPKPRQSASNTSLDQLNKRPPLQRDQRHSPQKLPADGGHRPSAQPKSPQPRRASPAIPHEHSQPAPSPKGFQKNQRPPRGVSAPVSPSDESYPSYDRRKDDVRRQRPSGFQSEQESMSEVPRRVRRPNAPKSPAAINQQNHIQGTTPHPPANGRIRHKRPDSGGDADGLWMTQSSTGRSETRFGPTDWDGTQELLPANSVRSDLCGSCTSLASQHGGQTDSIKPLAWREGVDGMITILSGMYGKVLIIMGISFPLAEVISHQLPSAFYEGFYLYLFGLSIAFICYVYLFVIGPEEGLLCCKQRLDKPRSVPSNYSPAGSFYLRSGAVLFGIASMIYSGLEFGQYFELARESYCYTIMQTLTPSAQMTFTFIQLYFVFFNSKLCIRQSRSLSKFGLMHLVATNICVWLHIVIQESVHQIVLNWEQHGGIYHDAMQTIFKQSSTTPIPFSNVSLFNETSLDYPLNSSFTTAVPNASLSLLDEEVTTETVFTTTIKSLSEVYASSKSSNDLTNDYNTLNTSLNNFGDFNMTNVTLSSVFNSTNSSIANATADPTMSASDFHFLTHACRHASVIGRMVQTASPFMFPCTIQYSLICASILYIMWKNVQKREMKSKTKHKNEISGSATSIAESTKPNKNYYQVDCSNSNKGLFMGIFFLVMCIIGLVLFYVLVDEPEYRDMAVFELYVCELTIYFFTTIAVITATIQVRKLKYDPYRNIDLDSMLMIISQAGIYLYCVFGLISSHFNLKNDVNSVLSLLSNLIILIQATVQTIFILDAIRRNSNAPEHIRRKPARESVTFLLVCNLAMWIMNSLETHKAAINPTPLNFYGFWAWTIISHISTPLAIFYRFHSTVCLCEIWKKMYKPSKVSSGNIKH